MKDRADYARKGIARGRSVVVIQYPGGILFVAETPSRSLHKHEIYDRIAFAAVGKYNEFENLRVAGVRLADLRGYSFDRADVTGRANMCTPRPSARSSPRPKPYEVEIVVAEVGRAVADDEIYRLTYDGSVAQETAFAVMGGSADQIHRHVADHYTADMSLPEALRLAVDALGRDNGGGEPRQLTAESLEVAILDRDRPRRRFRRVATPELDDLLAARRRHEHVVWPDGPPHLRPRGRVRRHVHVPRPATAFPDEVARYLFRRVVTWGRSSNVFLSNGARLYLDVGSHPEYATPECDLDHRSGHARQSRGECWRGLLVDAEKRLREEGIAGDVYLFKNNTDSAGNSYGCHENYLRRPAHAVLSPSDVSRSW